MGSVCVYVCVYVCVREKERELAVSGNTIKECDGGVCVRWVRARDIWWTYGGRADAGREAKRRSV